MKGDQPKRRLFRLLRRTVKGGSHSERNPADENALWLSHERTLAGLRDAGEATQRIATSLSKQRGTVDSIADRARAVAARAHELSTSFARVIDSFDRLGLVALNAGLEAARLGESGGHPLALVSDEVRTHATRGGDGARELTTALGEIDVELAQLHVSLDRVREVAADGAQDASRIGVSIADSERALVELGDRLRKSTGSDPETARAITEATEHARALLVALGALRGKVPQGLVVSALRPMLEPLARLLADEELGDEEAPE